MKKIILLISLLIIGIQSCNIGATGIWKDEQIEQSLKNEIELLDKQVIEAVITNNTDLLKSLMSDILLENSGDNIEQLIEQASNAIPNKDYKVLNQYHTINSATGIGNTIMSGVSGLNDYVIHYQALNDEMFISLLIPKSKLDEFIITNIYGKYPDGWKLNILQLGQYKVNGKTAPELYTEAKAIYEKGYLVDATNIMFLSSRVVNPATIFWKYQKEDEMKAFYEKVFTEINSKYKFPMTLDDLDSKPQILAIYSQRIEDAYYPIIEYYTKLDLEDTVKTKAEFEKVHLEMVKTFTGIEKNKDYILYKAFSEMPDGKKLVSTYGFVKELK